MLDPSVVAVHTAAVSHFDCIHALPRNKSRSTVCALSVKIALQIMKKMKEEVKKPRS